jgi:DNA-binding MarR family transcriptional regulator
VTRWLDDDEMRAWRGLVEVTAGVEADLEAELVERHRLTVGDYGVLVHLSEAEGEAMRMCDLAARLHLSPSGLTRRIDGLVRSGLVRREPSVEDRRVMRAVLTPAGRSAIEAAAPTHVDGVRRHLLDHLDRDQIQMLGQAWAAVQAARANRAGTPDRLGRSSAQGDPGPGQQTEGLHQR